MKTVPRWFVVPTDPVCTDCEGYGAKQNIGSQMPCEKCGGKGRIIAKGATIEVDDREPEHVAQELLDLAAAKVKDEAASAAVVGVSEPHVEKADEAHN